MRALWCEVNGEGEIMLSAGSRSRRGEFAKADQIEKRGQGGGLGFMPLASSTTLPSGGYLIRGRKVGGNWGVRGVRLGT